MQETIRILIALVLAVLAGAASGWAQGEELPPGHPPLEADTVQVDTAGISLSIPHIFVEERGDGSRAVTRYTLIAVPSTRGATGEAPSREFIFGLPRGATGPPIVEPAGAEGPLPAGQIRPLPELDAWAIDLPPWEEAIQIKVESFSPESLSKSGFQQRFFYPVLEMSVLVKPMDLPIAGRGLSFSGRIDSMNMSQWISEPIQAGGVLDFHVHDHAEHAQLAERTKIEPVPNRMTLPRPVLVLVFFAFLGFAVVMSQMKRI